MIIQITLPGLLYFLAGVTVAQVLWWAVPDAVRRARSELTRRKAGKAALSQPCR